MAIVSTYGPRGFLPKYGIDENGQTVELYTGNLIKANTAGYNLTYNYDFLDLPRDQEPDLLKGVDSYTGKSDAERIVYLKDQLAKLTTVYNLYLQKVKDLAQAEPALANTLGTVLTATATSLIKTQPIAALFIGVPGLLIKFLNSQTGRQIQAFKAKKIQDWAAIMAGIETQYKAYQQELKSLERKQALTVGAIGTLAYFIFRPLWQSK